jgi:hypothetical protein
MLNNDLPLIYAHVYKRTEVPGCLNELGSYEGSMNFVLYWMPNDSSVHYVIKRTIVKQVSKFLEFPKKIKILIRFQNFHIISKW